MQQNARKYLFQRKWMEIECEWEGNVDMNPGWQAGHSSEKWLGLKTGLGHET